MDRIQRLLVPKYQEKNLKYPKHLRTNFPDSKKQESITKSGRIRGAHEILGLGDLSWFMRCLNEPIARMANSEDHCTGRFWEGRFKSQALLDARAVLACMAYVDLNPIRAAMAKTPEQSDYTSIQARILHPQDSWLRPFAEQDENGIPFDLKEYLQLVDWGGREIKYNKQGYIPTQAPPILSRLKMDTAPVLDYLGRADQPLFAAVGPVTKLRAFAQSVGRSFIKGQLLGKRLCPERI